MALGTLVILGGVFVLGMSARRAGHGRQGRPARGSAAKDPLARLDEPLAGASEAPPELKAHQALTDAGPSRRPMPLGSAPMTRRGRGGPRELAPPPVVATSAKPATAPGAANAPRRRRRWAPRQRPARARAPWPGSAPGGAEACLGRLACPPRQRGGAGRVMPRPVRSSGHYTIQVGVVPRRADAERLASRLAARQPRIVAADVPGKGRWYRVQIGAFETRSWRADSSPPSVRSGCPGHRDRRALTVPAELDRRG